MNSKRQTITVRADQLKVGYRITDKDKTHFSNVTKIKPHPIDFNLTYMELTSDKDETVWISFSNKHEFEVVVENTCINCGERIDAGYKFCSPDCALEFHGASIDPKTLAADGYAMMNGAER